MDNQDALIDKALDSYPLVNTPPTLVSQVMTQITTSEPAPAPVHFRLELVDWAVPTFVAFFAVMVFVVLGYANTVESPVGGGMLFAFLEAAGNWPLLFVCIMVEIGLAAAVGVWLWADQPGYQDEWY